MMRGITYSFLSGLLAATASLCGKFSMAAEETLYLCESTMKFLRGEEDEKTFSYSTVCENVILWTRIGFFIAMVLCNAVMWTVFTKALHMCATTLEATITNTAANFCFTAIYGQVCFGESLSIIWWLGTSLIIVGLLLMHKSNQLAVIPEKKRKRN